MRLTAFVVVACLATPALAQEQRDKALFAPRRDAKLEEVRSDYL